MALPTTETSSMWRQSMHDEMDRAIPRQAHARRERVGEECPKCFAAHFARSHGELAMPALGIGVAIDPNVVRWIQERGVDPCPRTHHFLEKRQVSSVAAADPMLPRNPDVAGSRSRLDRNHRDDFVVRIGCPIKDHVYLADRETGQGQIDAEIEFRQLDLQQLEIPPRPEGDLVVGEPQGALLRFGEARQRDGRHFGKAQCLSRQKTAMPGNYRTVRIDQNWVREPKLADRSCDLIQLAFGMGPGVSAVGNKGSDRAVGYCKRRQRGWICHRNGPSVSQLRNAMGKMHDLLLSGARSPKRHAGPADKNSGTVGPGRLRRVWIWGSTPRLPGLCTKAQGLPIPPWYSPDCMYLRGPGKPLRRHPSQNAPKHPPRCILKLAQIAASLNHVVAL